MYVGLRMLLHHEGSHACAIKDYVALKLDNPRIFGTCHIYSGCTYSITLLLPH